MLRTLTATLLLSGLLPAAMVSIDFVVTITAVPGTLPSGSTVSLGQTYAGQVSYDDALVPGSGPASVTPDTDPSITLTFNFDGQSYGAGDDIFAPFGPELFFEDGAFVGVLFDADAKLPSAAPDSVVQFEASPSSFGFSYDGGFTEGGGPLTIVPEPTAALLFAMGTGLVLLRRKRS